MAKQPMEDLKSYKILILGAPGSGKTVFLASMFKQLSIVGNKAGFHLKTEDAEQANKLNYLYFQIEDPGAEWPEGTQRSDTVEYKFTCAVQASSEHKVFHFTYFDYAGGWLTEPYGKTPLGFENALKNSDVFLGVFDAQKILAAMNDETQRPRLRHEVTSIIQRIQGSAKPIHFVIMKWDLVEGKFSLNNILKELNQIPEFYEFTQWRIKNAPNPLIRIIPVSSVGNGFAELQPDGVMRKKPGVIPRPIRIEMPLACVLIDTFKERHKIVEMKGDDIRNKHQKRKGITASEALTALVKIGQIPVIGFLGIMTRKKVREAEKRFYELILKALARRTAAKKGEVAKIIGTKIAEELRPITDEQTALEHVLSRFLDLEGELVRDFPASQLKD